MAEQQKKLVLGLAGATFIGMPAIAWLIAGWTDVSMFDRLRDGIALPYQLLFGAAGGLFIGVIAQWFVGRQFMQAVTSKYMEMIGPLDLDRSEMIFISLSAGVGEELLFRGAIQPLIGIWPTAVLFIALHGYLSFRYWRIFAVRLAHDGHDCPYGIRYRIHWNLVCRSGSHCCGYLPLARHAHAGTPQAKSLNQRTFSQEQNYCV